MAGFIEGVDRGQLSLLPESLDQWVEESNPVRVIDAFVEQLDLDELGFKLAAPADLGRPGYNPALHLKLYVYGYLNRIQSSRRLERECQRNLEVIWLLGRLAPTTRRLQISARTMAQRSRRYVLGSSSSAARWAYWRR